MRSPYTKCRNITNRIIALSLVLWLSGATCVFGGCEMAMAKIEATQKSNNQMRADHSCCKRAKSKKEAKLVEEFPVPPPSTKISCCPFASQPTVQARKANTETAPVISVSVQTQFFQPNEERRTSFSYHARLPDRGSTHIKNCIFLI